MKRHIFFKISTGVCAGLFLKENFRFRVAYLVETRKAMTYQSNVKFYFDFLFPDTILQAREKLLHELFDFVLINERSQNCSLAEK